MKTLNKLFTRNSTTISFMGIMCVALLISSCGGGVVKKEKANDWVEMGVKGQVKKMIPDSGVYRKLLEIQIKRNDSLL